MGQKTNPTILRIGNLNEWKSKYIEKKATESSTVIFRDLEIKKFIYQSFYNNNLKIQNLRIYYSENALHAYISYYNALKLTGVGEKVKVRYSEVESTFFRATLARMKQAAVRKQVYSTKAYKRVLINPLKTELFQKHYMANKKSQRLNAIKHFKTHIAKEDSKILNHPNAGLFLSKILKSLSLFTYEKQSIFLTLRQVNKEESLLQTMQKRERTKLKKNFVKLRKFQQNEFFKKGLDVLFSSLSNHRSPSSLAEFVAFYLKKLKRPNFFLRFLKLALTTFVAEKFSHFERVRIKITGRFNGAPRSTHKFVNVGKNIPVSTLDAQIDFGESTAYTANGTFGVKVWTYKNAQ